MNDVRDRLILAYEVLSRDSLKKYVEGLAQILKSEDDVREARLYKDKFKVIVEEFESACGHTATNLFRKVGWEDDLTYYEVLDDVADEINLKTPKRNKIVDLESSIVEKYLEDLWGRLDEKQRTKLKNIIIDTIKAEGDSIDDEFIKRLAASGSPFLVLMGANAAGFSLYIAATSGLAAISSALGLGLSFSAYTGLASGLSVVLGPLGIISAGVFAFYRLGQPAYQRKIIPCIMLLSAMRGEIEMKKKKTRKTAKKSS